MPADKPDPLAEARQLYNQRQFAAALTAAERARLTPALADRADLIAARAYLERFRESAAPDDLTNARERLRRIDPSDSIRSSAPSSSSGSARRSISTNRTAPRRTCSRRCSTTAARCRPIRAIVSWTGGRSPSIATRGCVPSPAGRAPINGFGARMREELTTRPGSSTAAYWLAAAARSQGDLQGGVGRGRSGLGPRAASRPTAARRSAPISIG